MISPRLPAQTLAALPAIVPLSLPDAPSTVRPAELQGGVEDSHGDLLPGATVTLTNTTGTLRREVVSGMNGRFDLAALPPGTYNLVVRAPGLGTLRSGPVELLPGEARELPPFVLAIASASSSVDVSLSRTEFASAEVHELEKQRTLGIFPNFYTSFTFDAAPLNAKQKMGLVLHATLDPAAFATAGIVAGVEQGRGTFPGYGSGPEGFAKRYGAAYADGFTGKFLGAGVYPALFRQDPRYFFLGEGTVRTRATHAIVSVFFCRGDRGQREFNYSHVLGNASAGALSSLYHPDSDGPGRLTLDNALIGLGGAAVENLAREFLLRRFTTHVNVYGPAAGVGTADRQP